jgi:predicted DsbA family dithiol-disulfide isomerase
VAGSVGLDRKEAEAVLASDRYAADVRDREEHFQSLGIHAVPSVIINNRHLIQGGQPPEMFEQALRQVASAAQEA